MKIFKSFLVLGLSVVSISVNAQTEFTAAGRNVGQVDVFTNGNVLIIPAQAGGWGAPSCPTNFFVQLSPTTDGYSEMLATILTARAAELPVRFSGVCGSGPFFNADRVRLQ